MGRGLRRPSPALVIAFIALFAALGGSVYAAGKRQKRINGKAIKVKSLPGNRVKVGSLPGNRIRMRSLPGNRLRLRSIPGDRLMPNALPANRIVAGSITGTQVDETTLGEVPNAAKATEAATAIHAVESETAIVAESVNGYRAECEEGTVLFLGACWESDASTATTAPAAALACASRGGYLPEPLQLVAFAQTVSLAGTGEWTSGIHAVTGLDQASLVTVTQSGQLHYANATVDTRQFRCVHPLLR